MGLAKAVRALLIRVFQFAFFSSSSSWLCKSLASSSLGLQVGPASQVLLSRSHSLYSLNVSTIEPCSLMYTNAFDDDDDDDDDDDEMANPPLCTQTYLLCINLSACLLALWPRIMLLALSISHLLKTQLKH